MKLRHQSLGPTTGRDSKMNGFTIAATVMSGFAAATIAFAGAADAAPIVDETAAEAADSLQADGYAVQFNGIQRGPLTKCMVTGVHGLDGRMMSMAEMFGSMDPATFGTVYLDINCPNSNN
jgi:hypothetical protein